MRNWLTATFCVFENRRSFGLPVAAGTSAGGYQTPLRCGTDIHDATLQMRRYLSRIGVAAMPQLKSAVAISPSAPVRT